MPFTDRIEAELLRLADVRATDRTFCPSEAARNLWPDSWRGHMPDVRSAAETLVAAGRLVCKQRGEIVDIAAAKGPIRLAAKV